MKKLATIHSSPFSKEQTTALKLQEQSYILLIPTPLLSKYGIFSDNITFDLILDKNRITLLGPSTRESPEANQSSAVIDT